ncbi:putative leucine-rich repeat receptor-like protein kinase [Dorcoceras hygrometricum]|uniref:Putative leucine-rich repeat receptor-like protein kinase n=1 Tax=Dorcoceras hygrometricum TaxID=472368 RepID=A0A2Z6ZQS7_9LAMI|nr:putative leucine-rich repeat receptor-like protein kinase [Dorcoceras hygrometricum]
MELVLARFQRTNPPTLAGTEGGARAEAWLVQMEELFDTLEYAPEKRLKLAVLQLRDDAQRWWRSTSRMLRDSGTMLTWDVFCEAVFCASSVHASCGEPRANEEEQVFEGIET